MNNEPNTSSDPNIEGVRDEANKPEPLYDKTDRNFQRHDQGPLQGDMKSLMASKMTLEEKKKRT